MMNLLQARLAVGLAVSLALGCLAAAGLPATEKDLYVQLPQKLPAGAWKKYLGEIGSDTLVTYKFGKDADKQSTVSMVWFQNLYNTREMLDKTAPTLKKILQEQIHKGDKLESEKLSKDVFGLVATDKNTLVVYYEFKRDKEAKGRPAGSYRYYYLFKKIDEKTSISLGIEVRLLDPEHAGAIDQLLASCSLRTEAEILAEAQANAPKPKPKPAEPAADTAPADAAAPTAAQPDAQ